MNQFHLMSMIENAPADAVGVMVNDYAQTYCYIGKLYMEDQGSYQAEMVGENARPVPTYRKDRYTYHPFD